MEDFDWCGCCSSELDSDNYSGGKCKSCSESLICDNCRGNICDECLNPNGEALSIDDAFMQKPEKGPSSAEISENSVLDWLRLKGSPATPTVIGQRVGGKSGSSASSWACKVCKRLIDKGLIAKTNKGQYYSL